MHEKVHDAFVGAMVARTKALRIGPGLGNVELGPLVSEAARAKVMKLVDQAVAQGAKIASGGRIPSAFNTGWFYEPTILTDVTPSMDLMQAEMFGPVAPIIVSPSAIIAWSRSHSRLYCQMLPSMQPSRDAATGNCRADDTKK